MVRILPLVGAAALFAQSAFAAAVPVRRTHDSNSNNNSNNYNQGSSYNQGNSYQQGSSYQQQQQQQESNNYGSNNYNMNQYNQNQYQQQQQQESNNYNNYNQNQYQQQQQYTTTVATEMAQETQVMMMDTTTSSMMEDTTSVMMMEDTTSSMMMEDTTSTMMAEQTQMAMETSSTDMAMETSTVMQQEISSTSPSYSMPSYGSGSNNNNNGYNNCVQQCMAQFGAPPSTMTQESLPPPTGTGAVHTILVAPEGAGLRYMPFAVNASIGDTIRYVWTTPANHTATLSSALAICNKSGIADQRNFVSGVKNASAGTQVFDVTVETADTQFFYCSVAQHCQKGMFGMINPGSNIGGQNTVGTMMASLMQSNPQLQAAYEYMRQNVTGTSAANWGMNIPLDGVPESQYEEVAANVLFTQANFAANPGMLETNQGATTPDGSPVQIVSGLNVLLSDTSNAPIPSLSVSAVPSPTGSLTPVNADTTGAAFSTRSVGTWAAAVVAVAGWLLI